MVNGFLGLRHDAVIGSDNQDCQIGDVGSPRAHLGKCFVAWGVEKRDLSSIGKSNHAGTDMLSDPAGLA